MKAPIQNSNARRDFVLGILSCLLVALSLHTPRNASAHAGATGKFTLTTSAFGPGAEIPQRYTCSSEDLSPPLTWSDPPAGAKSFALILEDPDAPGGTFVHWVVFNLPSVAGGLPEGAGRHSDFIRGDARQGGGGAQGLNDFDRVGYNGPCPPPGKPHRYFFRLFALDSTLSLTAGSTAKKDAVSAAMKGHTLAQAEMMGRYRR